MTANEKRAAELMRMWKALPPFTVLVLALDVAERRGEERALRLAAMSLPREIVAHIRGGLRARRARARGKR